MVLVSCSKTPKHPSRQQQQQQQQRKNNSSHDTNSETQSPPPSVTSKQQALYSTLHSLRLLVEKERTIARISTNRLKQTQKKLEIAQQQLATTKRDKTGSKEDDGREDSKEQIDRLKVRVEQAVKDRKNAEDRLKAVEKVVVEQNEELERITGELEGVRKEVMINDNRTNNNNEEGGSRGAVAQVQEKVEELQRKLILADSEILEKRQQISKLSNYCDEKNSEINQLEKRLRNAREELEYQEKLVAEKEQVIQVISLERNGLESRVQHVEGDLKERNWLIENKLKPVLEEIKEKNRDLNAELLKTREQVQLANDRTDQRTLEFQNREENLTTRLRNAMEVLRNTQRRFSAVESNCAEQVQTIADLRSEKAANETKISALDDELKHRVSSLTTLNDLLKMAEQSIAQSEHSMTGIIAENKVLKKQLVLSDDRREMAETRAARKDLALLDLEGLIRAKRLQVQELEKERDDAMESTSKLTKLSNELQKALRTREAASKEHAILAASRSEDASIAIHDLKAALSQKRANVQGLSDDLASAEGRIDDLVGKLEVSRNNLLNNAEELQARSSQSKELERLLEEYKRTLSQRELDLETANAELNSTRDKLIASERSVTFQSNFIIDRDTENARLRAEIDSREQQIEGLRGDVAELESEAKLCQRKISSLSDEKMSMWKDLDQTQTEKMLLSSEISQLKDSLSKMKHEVWGRERLVGEGEKSMHELRLRINSLEEIIKSKQRQITVLESHLEGTSSILDQYTENEELLASCTGQLREKEALIAELKGQLEELRTTMADRSCIGNSVPEKSALEEREKVKLAEKASSEENGRLEAESKLHNMSDNVGKLKEFQSKLDAQNSRLLSLDRKLCEKEASCELNALSLKRKSAEIAKLKTEIAGYSRRVDTLLEEIDDLRAKFKTSCRLVSEHETKLKAKDEHVRKLNEQYSHAKQEVQKYRGRLACLQSEQISRTEQQKDIRSEAATSSEVLGLKSKLEAKEKAIRNLHNWCRFINEKLHIAEQLLSDRNEKLNSNKQALSKLEEKTKQMTKKIASQEADRRDANLKCRAETSGLRERIQVLNAHARKD